MSRIYPRAPEAKVFWFFSSEKNTLVRKKGSVRACMSSPHPNCESIITFLPISMFWQNAARRRVRRHVSKISATKHKSFNYLSKQLPLPPQEPICLETGKALLTLKEPPNAQPTLHIRSEDAIRYA
jgi:hypothetical protein